MVTHGFHLVLGLNSFHFILEIFTREIKCEEQLLEK